MYRSGSEILSFDKILVCAILIFIIVPLRSISLPISAKAYAIENKLNKMPGGEKSVALLTLTGSYISTNPNKAVTYASESLELAEKSGDKIGTIKALNMLGNAYLNTPTSDKGEDFLKKALIKAEKLRNDTLIAYTKLNIANMYCGQTNYRDALDEALSALKIYKDLECQKGLAKAYQQIAKIYYYLVNFEKALEYNNLALEIAQKSEDIVMKATLHLNIALIHIDLRNNDEAMKYNRMSLKALKSVNDEEGIAVAYTNQGRIFLNQDQFDSALVYLKRALKMYSHIIDHRKEATVHANIGQTYLRMGELDKCEAHFMKSIDLAQEIKALDVVALNYQSLSQYFLKIKDYENAYYYKDEFQVLFISLFNEENRSKISEMEVRIQTEQMSKEKQLLEAQNRQQLLFFIIISVLVVLIAIVIYIMYVTKKRANRELSNKNKQITSQNSELEHLNAELHEVNAAKDKFFSIIAHDLKNPLWWFRNVTEMLATKYDKLSKEKMFELTKSMGQSAEYSLHLIDNLLLWSRSQTGRIEYTPMLIDLHDLAHNTISHLKLNADNKNIALINNVEKETMAKADKNMIITVLSNLVSNAIKYTPADGKVELKVIPNGTHVEVHVCDTGIGISQKDQDKLFRLDVHHVTPGTAKEEGTGLGLILCKDFVEANHGSIRFESLEGQGSSFIFTLPKN